MEQYVTRSEMDCQFVNRDKDITNIANLVREEKLERKEDMKSIWKAIDSMLFRVAAVVGASTTLVLFVFKLIEIGVKK